MRRNPRSLSNVGRKVINFKRNKTEKLPPINRSPKILKSVSPTPIFTRGETPIFQVVNSKIETYVDELEKLYSRNIILRSDWILAKQKLLNFNLKTKVDHHETIN